ncbi:MAG TPA: hypothetical protein VGJ32_12070 [Solirubrobacteraceae bacterium]
MFRPAILACALAGALAAGCGQSDDKEAAGSGAMMKEKAAGGAMKDTAMVSKDTATVRVVSSKYGRILGDRRGQAFYRFDKEKTRRSECYGACAKSWPPVLSKGRPAAGKGAKASLLGTTRRRDGKAQVTYAGRPLYYYTGDAPGRVLCQGVTEFGGRWLVVKPSGATVG